jgi:hypothetical protein
MSARMSITATSGAKAGVPSLLTVTFASVTFPLDVAVLLGAFAGSAVFVLSAIEYHWLMRIAYLLCGTTISYLCAGWTADSLSLANHTVAAILNGATCILLLNGLIERARSGKLLSSLIDLFRNGRK